MTTPARRQYLQIKSQYPDAILMYQVGDFYETFDEDARIAAHELQIFLTKRDYGEEKVPLAGIPLHALENYVGKLITRGYKVAICDQVGEVGKGIVERAVTRILTAGTLSEPSLLPTKENNYLAAIATARAQSGLAAVDVSTGEFSVTWFAPDEMPAALEAELQRLAPVECLLVEGSRTDAFHFPSATMTVTHCPIYFFEEEAARTRLCRHFGVQSLDAYGCAQAPQAIAAAGAIIAYLEKMNGALLSLLAGLRSYRTTNYMVLDAHTQRNLDLLGERVVAHSMAACSVYWTGQSHQWEHDDCAAQSRSRCLTWVNWRPAWRAWKNSTKARHCAAVLPCACKGWVTWSALPGVCARGVPSPTRRGRCAHTSN